MNYKQTMSANSKTFYLASRLLPSDARADATLLYSFCRSLDDAVDEADSPLQAAANIKRIRAELAGQGTSAMVADTLALVQRRGLSMQAIDELVEGVASDTGEVRFQTDEELIRYCYRVAGTVGLLMSPILGVTSRDAYPHAVDLGIAMQLTNICRDVAEDAKMGRVYLPAERLKRVGISHAQVLDGSYDKAAMSEVIRQVLDLAEQYYASGEDGYRYIPAGARRAVAAAARMYREIGHVIRRRGWTVTTRAVVSRRRKAAQLLLAAGVIEIGRFRTPRKHIPALHETLHGLPGTNPHPVRMPPFQVEYHP